jgi:hypothetical protein
VLQVHTLYGTVEVPPLYLAVRPYMASDGEREARGAAGAAARGGRRAATRRELI